MNKKVVTILFGGCSSEYEVSLQSAAAVIEHIDISAYQLVLVGITREGLWLKYEGGVADIRSDKWHEHASCRPTFVSPSREVKGFVELGEQEYRLIPVDVVFPILHGKFGEDGTVQGLLELAGIPYVGCNMLSSAICMDKDIAHSLVSAAGISTPRSLTILQGDDIALSLRAADELGYPLFIKPAKSGSSFGITKAFNKQQLREGVTLAFEHDNKVVIEQNVDGFEVGCAVLGNSELLLGAVDEIEITGGFFDYTEKYTLQSSKIHLPARIDPQTALAVKETAVRIYRTLGCRGFARVDMFLTPSGELVFNEVNTIPGFTSASRYPNMLGAIGMNYSEIIDRLITLAVAGDEAK
ncbi:MAG: D-alanine--D-serine ligase VanG [Candidatus Cohnella colombiensis]|uniref:D-alanine--D-alanine ligase n=1 Tax=Candidatus Cohnella colombiensis TaxID=3121368 RepID=A0AA95EYT8_9BACL|nr:MAG: D-alanine--D-serine ligase VanG [Cohnella sp.]